MKRYRLNAGDRDRAEIVETLQAVDHDGSLSVDATAPGRAAVSLRAPELRAVLWENPMYGILGGALETWPMVEL